MGLFVDYYTVLKVPEKASSEAIRDRYHRLAKEHHPDRNSSDSAKTEMQIINEAYAILIRPEKRELYDKHRYMHYATSTKNTISVSTSKPQSLESQLRKLYEEERPKDSKEMEMLCLLFIPLIPVYIFKVIIVIARVIFKSTKTK